MKTISENEVFVKPTKHTLIVFEEYFNNIPDIEHEIAVISKILAFTEEEKEKFILNELDGFFPFLINERYEFAQIGGFFGAFSIGLFYNFFSNKSYLVENYNFLDRYEIKLNMLLCFLKNQNSR